MNHRVAALSGGVAVVMMIWLLQSCTGHRAPVVSTTATAAHPPRTAPTTQSAQATTLPEEFAVLLTRSPFGHGHHAAGVEESFVFKGVMQNGDRFTAFLEDVSTKKVIEAAAGDAIAHGRIKNVDLDSIEYEATGKSLRVQVGQNLMGQVVAVAPPASAPASPNPPGDAGAPGPPPGQIDGQPQMDPQPDVAAPKVTGRIR